MISLEEGVVIQAWVKASRKLVVIDCPDEDCWSTKDGLYKRLAQQVSAETGKAVCTPRLPPPVT
ncbi:hypothetical protein SMC26_39745 [Actinomadura fulvescens]|uniref:Uncharacterized protein n=1 Tax=Actinomadura fulvescens TaxID=46160 RepID=A0ABN3QL17_9ACTN